MYKIFIKECPALQQLTDLFNRQLEFECSLVLEHIWKLAENPRPLDCRRIATTEGWRIYVLDYRIIYIIYDRDKIIIVLDISPRVNCDAQG
ncbi:hypothetical protein NIES2100_62490 [Calothrix sp. NIES-2100]|uniref:type II toxin-antitoxin system RelE family toxin n=1 Tax=Calothrix sp. NIES-2100 TaxID=1954172 RepID=UPI000B5FC1C7|nr:hypothetical protein NIES2100_62490 [Calothrix sp. NIES-2100]